MPRRQTALAILELAILAADIDDASIVLTGYVVCECMSAPRQLNPVRPARPRRRPPHRNIPNLSAHSGPVRYLAASCGGYHVTVRILGIPRSLVTHSRRTPPVHQVEYRDVGRRGTIPAAVTSCVSAGVLGNPCAATS